MKQQVFRLNQARCMPELDWQSGYFGVLGSMVAIALAMIWGFYRTGWFK